MSWAFNIPFSVEKAPSWTNPYVTDRLVAYWDGEWNAGGGNHDASAVVWKDLGPDNHDIDITGAVVTPNSLSLSGSSVSCSLPEVKRPEFTVEVVMTSTPGSGAALWLANPSSVIGVIMDWTANGIFYYPWAAVGQTNTRHGQKTSFCLTYKAGSQQLYINGSLFASTSGGINSSNTLSRMFIGEYNGTKAQSVDVNSIRLYSAHHDQQTVSANYAIDARRFGL